MRQTEQKFWDRVRNRFALEEPSMFCTRIENIVEVGMPDLQVTTRAGGTSMIEMKAVKEFPVREGTAVLGSKAGLSPDQKNWLYMHRICGGRGYILVGIGPRYTFMVDAKWCDQVNNFTRSDFEQYSAAVNLDEAAKVLSNPSTPIV